MMSRGSSALGLVRSHRRSGGCGGLDEGDGSVDSVGSVDCVRARSAGSVAAVESAGLVGSTRTASSLVSAGIDDSVGVVDGLGALGSAGVVGSGVGADQAGRPRQLSGSSNWSTRYRSATAPPTSRQPRSTRMVCRPASRPDSVQVRPCSGPVDSSAVSTVAPAGTEFSESNTKVPAEPAPGRHEAPGGRRTIRCRPPPLQRRRRRHPTPRAFVVVVVVFVHCTSLPP